MPVSCVVLNVNQGDCSHFRVVANVHSIPSPPLAFKQCPRCDDMMDTHCKWLYCLYILLQDEKGSELIVSLSGKEVCVLYIASVKLIIYRCVSVLAVARCQSNGLSL